MNEKPPDAKPTRPTQKASPRAESETIDDEGAPPTEERCAWCKGSGHVPRELNATLERMSEAAFGTPDPYDGDDDA